MSKEQKILVPFFNKVKDYISMEFSEELSREMSLLSNIDTTTAYIKNCIHLRKTVPYTANGIVKILKKQKEKT